MCPIQDIQLEVPFTQSEKNKLSGVQDDADENPAQVSSGEKTDGTETGLRSFSPKDVADMAGTHGGGGSAGVGAEYAIKLGSGADIATKIANAPAGGIPAGLTLVDGTDGSVDAELTGNSNDLVIIHGENKVMLKVGYGKTKTFTDATISNEEPESGSIINNSSQTQTKLIDFIGDVADGASYIWIKLI